MRKPTNRGQALVMVSLGLLAMFAIIGLAIDLGWSYFVKKSARAAADAAAMAAAREALTRATAVGGAFDCVTLDCQMTRVRCSSIAGASNLRNGCLYSSANGFTDNLTGNQTVWMASNVPPSSCAPPAPAVPNCIPTAPGIKAFYWVTATTAERIPQLFSAVLGNTMGTSSARATAAVAEAETVGGLILINRRNDTNPLLGTGGNLRSQGGASIIVPNGIMMASTADGEPGGRGVYAGDLQGAQKGGVTSPFTFIMKDATGVGKACAGNLGCQSNAPWLQVPSNEPDQDWFTDPMKGKGQPPLTSSALTQRPHPGPKSGPCTISAGPVGSPTILEEGYHYCVYNDGSGDLATGEAVELRGNGQNQYFQFQGGAFSDFFFFGGLKTGAGNVVVNLIPGRYVLAGVKGGGSNPLLEVSNGTTLNDNGPVDSPNTNAGEMFIFTGANSAGAFTYPGMDFHLEKVPLVQAIKGQLLQGVSGFKMGANDASYINLHGIKKDDPNLPTDQNVMLKTLSDFAPVVFWQDQANTKVLYDQTGNIVGDINLPDPNTTLASPLSPEMYLGANAGLHLYGTAYQPRGGWLTIGGGSWNNGALQIITGAVNVTAGGSITLQGPEQTVMRTIVALVE